MAIVYSAQPGTAVHHALTEGWPIEAHLLANLSEQYADLVKPEERYKRPGAARSEQPLAQGGFEVFKSIADFEAQRAKKLRR